MAGEFLLPSHELIELKVGDGTSVPVAAELVSDFARKRRISSTMVAYRLYQSERIKTQLWQQLRNTFYDLWQTSKSRASEESKNKEGGPSYYVLRRHHLGQGFLSVVNRLLTSGALTTSKAGKVLGVLLDANVLIDANRDYYPTAARSVRGDPSRKERCPVHLGEKTRDKVSLGPGRRSGRRTDKKVASDLKDDEVERLGRDPFLIAHALVDPEHRCVVTTENSKPKKQRANRKER